MDTKENFLSNPDVLQHFNLEADELIEQADEALYISKKRGRNRTTIWGSGLLFKGLSLRDKKSS